MRAAASTRAATTEASPVMPGALGHLYPPPVARHDEVEPQLPFRGSSLRSGAGHEAAARPASSVTAS